MCIIKLTDYKHIDSYTHSVSCNKYLMHLNDHQMSFSMSLIYSITNGIKCRERERENKKQIPLNIIHLDLKHFSN